MNLHLDMQKEFMAQRQQDLRAEAGAFHLPGTEWLRHSRRNNRVRSGHNG